MITLPIPPSTNNLFVNVPGRGRVPSSKYSAWQREAGWMLKTQRPARVEGKFTVALFMPRLKNGSDLDNRIKAALDLLVSHQIVKDDSLLERLEIEWTEAKQFGVRVTAYEARVA